MIRIGLASLALLAAALAPAGEPLSPTAQGTWPVEAAEAAGYPYDVPYGGYAPGGYEARVGSPYYWSVPGGTVPLPSAAGSAQGEGGVVHGQNGVVPAGGSSCGCNKGASALPAAGVGSNSYGVHGGYAGYGPGYGAAHGPAGDPYTYHFGPGFYRSNEFGHYRFPYYSYRRPWYDVGHPVRVRDTNLHW